MNSTRSTICLIEDDVILGEALTVRFELEGYAFDWYQDGKSAKQALQHNHYGVVISDLRLPDTTGEDIYTELLELDINLPPFIFITGYGAIDQAVRLLKLGAHDYLIKPFEVDVLLEKLEGLHIDRNGMEAPKDLLGVSPGMRAIEAMLPKLASHTASILISGESGTGKERVALKLHQLCSNGDHQPFIAVNCGALTETLLEAELFGHEKGAFTGALQSRKGVFERADNGTLFLDEIGDMPISMQVKVLRAIQEKYITRVGGESSLPVNIRLICATHEDLKALVTTEDFREDLYYRINVIHLKIPPLRERKEDILWLARKFLSEFSAANHCQKKIIPPQSEKVLTAYPWPGNVRELKHCLERACILSDSNILGPETLFEDLPKIPGDNAELEHSLSDYLMECEHKYIQKSLQYKGGQIQETASFLGISRKNLWEKMRKLGISRDDIE